MALLSTGPIPIHAGFAIGDNIVTVTFDAALINPGPVNMANWTVSDVGGPRVVTAAIVQLGGTVQLTLMGPPTGGAPGLVSFSPPPFDLIDGAARAVEAFANFPIV